MIWFTSASGNSKAAAIVAALMFNLSMSAGTPFNGLPATLLNALFDAFVD